jgi:hypothetical protein
MNIGENVPAIQGAETLRERKKEREGGATYEYILQIVSAEAREGLDPNKTTVKTLCIFPFRLTCTVDRTVCLFTELCKMCTYIIKCCDWLGFVTQLLMLIIAHISCNILNMYAIML